MANKTATNAQGRRKVINVQPVWVLSVDLQTKTATFQSGLADAAKSARGAFNDIKGGSSDMGRAVSGHMMEARHGVMLLGEEFGVHLPRSLTTFIASIGPVGAAMEAAFPFLAIAVGATLLLEHLAKMHEAGAKITEDQVKFGTATQNAFNQLDSKLLQAQIRADELRNDHLGALRLQLEAIDRESLQELVHSFGEVAKAADVVFADLKTSWYQFGIGSAGAKHALDEFQNQYDSLLTQGKDKEASDLLAGTRKSAEAILAAQKNMQNPITPSANHAADDARYNVLAAAHIELQKAGVGWTEKEVQAQQTLVDALAAQARIEQKVLDLKKLEGQNTTRAAGNAAAEQTAAAGRAAAESQLRMGEQSIAADRAVAEEQLSVRRGSIQARLELELSFAEREYQLKETANQQEIAALDKSGKEYTNQLKALQDKALELTAAHNAQIAELTAKANAETASRELRDLEESERNKIENTDKGSAARLAAIDAALKREEALNLQDTNYYRELLTQRVQAARDEAEQEAKLREESGVKAAEAEAKFANLELAGEKQKQAALETQRRVSAAQKLQEDIAFADAEYGIQTREYARELAALDKAGKDYQNKRQALMDKETQLTQQHENDIAAMREKAEKNADDKIIAEVNRFNDQMLAGLSQVIMGHETFTKMITQLGDQVVSGMIQNALKCAEVAMIGKEADAAKAARQAYNIGVSYGGPLGMVLGPTFAAIAFSTVSGFAQGGIVPGVGDTDSVPAMLTPGEGVIPKGVMEALSDRARSAPDGGKHVTVHVRPTYHVQTIDGDGMKAALDKHTDVLQRHFEGVLRKMNR